MNLIFLPVFLIIVFLIYQIIKDKQKLIQLLKNLSTDGYPAPKHLQDLPRTYDMLLAGCFISGIISLIMVVFG